MVFGQFVIEFLLEGICYIATSKSLGQERNQGDFSLRRAFPTVLSEQCAIVATLEDLRENTQRLESLDQRKLAALDELKKSLLHRAFSGQL